MAVTRLTCRSCEAKLKVSAEPGTAVKCPRCGKSTRIPEPEPEDDFEVVDEEDEEPAPKKRSDAIKPKNGKAPAAKTKRPRDEDEDPEDDFEEVDEEPAPKKRRDGITSKAARANSSAVSTSKRSRAVDDDDEDEEEERPRKRGKKKEKEKAGSPALLWIGIGGGLVVVAGIVVAILLLWPGKTKEPSKGPIAGPGPAPQPKGFQSPQEVFDAYKAAITRKDAKGMADCLAPEGRRSTAGELAYVFISTRSAVVGADPNGDGAKQLQPASAALDKHGLTYDATKDLVPKIEFNPNNPLGNKPQNVEQVVNRVLSMVKDTDALLLDLLNALFQLPNFNTSGVAGGTLKDVKITGETATGMVSMPAPPPNPNGIPNVTPADEAVQFVKTSDAGWQLLPARKLK
jgi:hypothetical protein